MLQRLQWALQGPGRSATLLLLEQAMAWTGDTKWGVDDMHLVPVRGGGA